jgi:hypothetical protein
VSLLLTTYYDILGICRLKVVSLWCLLVLSWCLVLPQSDICAQFSVYDIDTISCEVCLISIVKKIAYCAYLYLRDVKSMRRAIYKHEHTYKKAITSGKDNDLPI